MKNNRKIFKGFDCYELQQDDSGNIKLSNYNDVLNARRARIDMLLDNTELGDINFTKLNKAFNEKFMSNQEILSRLNEEDKEIAQEKSKIFNILDNLNDLSSIGSQDLLAVSLLLSDLSYIEKNIVLNVNKDSELAGLKDLFLEKKASGEDYTDEEYKDLVDYIDKINITIKLELDSRIK